MDRVAKQQQADEQRETKMAARREQEKADKVEKAKEHSAKLAKLEEARVAKVARSSYSRPITVLYLLHRSHKVVLIEIHRRFSGMRRSQRRKLPKTRRSARGKSWSGNTITVTL
jgi:hypothetical protein